MFIELTNEFDVAVQLELKNRLPAQAGQVTTAPLIPGGWGGAAQEGVCKGKLWAQQQAGQSPQPGRQCQWCQRRSEGQKVVMAVQARRALPPGPSCPFSAEFPVLPAQRRPSPSPFPGKAGLPAQCSRGRDQTSWQPAASSVLPHRVHNRHEPDFGRNPAYYQGVPGR